MSAAPRCAVAAMARNARKALQTLPADIPVRLADYDDRPGLERAFDGVAQLLFVASDGEARDMMRHHANVIAAAAARGVRRVVFAGIVDVGESSPFCYAPAYRDAEHRLVASGMEWTILRCGLYSDLVLDHWLLPARASGEVSLPVGSARIAPISRDGVAEALAAAISRQDSGSVHLLTGPVSCSFDEVAALGAGILGCPMRYSMCSPADYLARERSAMEEPWPHAYSTLCAAILEGRYDRVSADFERLVGRPPESLERFLRRSREPRHPSPPPVPR